METFAEMIKSIRDNKGMTIEEIADLVGVSSRSISNWADGKTQPTKKAKPKIILIAFDVCLNPLNIFKNCP